MKKLLTLTVLSFIGLNAMAFCPSGPNYWNCYEQEMQQIRMNQQLQQMNDNIQTMQQQQQQQRQQRQCYKDVWGNIQCF